MLKYLPVILFFAGITLITISNIDTWGIIPVSMMWGYFCSQIGR